MSGVDAYRIRCSVLHQSRLQHPNMEHPFVFQEPEFSVIEGHGILVEGLSYDGEPIDAVYMSAPIFIDAVISGARAWLRERGSIEPVATNLRRMIRRRTRPFGAVDAIGHFIT